MFKFLLVLLYVFAKTDGVNILAVIPTPSISHQVPFRPYFEELVKRGHSVTVITTDPAFPKGSAPQNYTEIDVHDISYKIWAKFVEDARGKAADSVVHLISGYRLMSEIFEAQMKTPEVQKLLSNKKIQFDLVISEQWTRQAIVFSHVYNASLIEFSSFGGLVGAYDVVGAAAHPILYPIPILPMFYKMSLMDKMKQLYRYYLYESSYKDLEKTDSQMLKRIFGPNTPDLAELQKKTEMLFLNVHPIWDLNRPVPPNVIYLGGLPQKPLKALPKELKNFLDSSKNGVIYVSYGTNVKPSLLPTEKLRIITKVFSQLPYDILWKWDKDHLEDCPKNVKIAKWYPQSDLLKHPKIKLFITQGGLQSTDEALTAHVPLLGMPMLGDQFFNTLQYLKLNIGLRLRIETLTENEFKNSIHEAIDNPRYRENIIKLHNIMNDQPQTSLERSIWWTEYVIRHKGASHLKAHAAHMSWFDYYEVELLLVCLLCITTVLMSVVLAIYYIRKLIKQFTYKIKMN